MNNYDPVDPLETLMAVCLGGVICIVILLSCVGCATTKCPECVPEVQVVRVDVPVPSCEPPPVLPILEYPEWPTLVVDPTEDELKAFYAACVATLNAREKIMLERIKSLQSILQEYRD